MPTLRERAVRLLIPSYEAEKRQAVELTNALLAVDPYELPPDELVRQLKEQFDAQLVMDLVDQLQWEPFGAGYQPGMEQQRTRAVNDSRRMWLYSVVAIWIVRLWTYYAVGESVQVVPADEGAVEPWDEFWKADRNSPVLATERLHDISNLLLVTGNRFFAFFLTNQDGKATVRRVRPEEIIQIVTKPGDSATPLFYKRQWRENDTEKIEYYPDWRWWFDEKYNADVLEKDAVVAGKPEEGAEVTNEVVMLHAPFEQKDETSLFGWPLLSPAGTPWIRSHRQYFENRLAVSRAVASYVRRRTTKAGSRAVDFIRSTLQSNLQTGGTLETNPPPVAGSEDIHNQAMETTDLPLRTGASDAKVDGEMFSWMAGMTGGIYPHYLGLGDAYRLATATAMEKPMQMQFSLYRNRLNAIFRDMVRIVLQAQERYNGKTYETYEAKIAADRLVELDLDLISRSAGTMFRDILSPQSLTGGIPDEMLQNITVYSTQSILQAMGAEDVGEMVNVEQYEEEPEEEAEIAEQDKVEPRGEPLPDWPEGEPVPITPEDVARAIKDWDRHMPDEAKGLLTARTLTPEEEAALEAPDA